MKETIDQHKRKHAKWAAPAVASVILPVHAQTSVPPKKPPCVDIEREITKTERNITLLEERYKECRERLGFNLTDLLITPAHAIPQECRDITSAIEVETEILTKLRIQLRECRGEEEPDE